MINGESRADGVANRVDLRDDRVSSGESGIKSSRRLIHFTSAKGETLREGAKLGDSFA